MLHDVDGEGAFAIAERLRRRVADTDGLPVTVSVGLASHPQHGAARDELLAAADTALYASKRTGKNRTTVAGADLALASRGPSDREVRLALLQAKDPQSLARSAQVATLAVEVARALGLPVERLADLRTAAQLHDVGMVAVPDEVLGKPGPLDEDELRLVQVHPSVGASLLRAWGMAGPARFVEEHHERIDGTGYPRGLRGEEIALESRIVHVVEASTAMTRARPYRRALSLTEAAAELERGAGTQFDAAVVGALLVIVEAPLSQAA